jgi:hypothetical protein
LPLGTNGSSLEHNLWIVAIARNFGGWGVQPQKAFLGIASGAHDQRGHPPSAGRGFLVLSSSGSHSELSYDPAERRGFYLRDLLPLLAAM